MPNINQHPLQKLVFTKGMNYDTAPEDIKEGEGRKRLNVRVMSSDGMETEAAEVMLGNTLATFTLPAGTNKVIGAEEYKQINKCYYLVHNSLKNHTILEYDIANESVRKVIQEAAAPPYFLNFQADHLITGITFFELDKDNHLLFWTDNYVNPADKDIYNEPKKINIEKAIAHTTGNYTDGYPAVLDPEFFFRIKQPMNYPPRVEYDDDLSQDINYMKDKLFQFKVQYFYDDKEPSSWSPISISAYPKSICGEVTTVHQNNCIKVEVDTGIEIVKRIRIAAKECNEPDYKLVADLNKEDLKIASNSTHVFTFYNDSNYLPLEAMESNKLFDFVPLRSKAEESIEGDRIVDGNITEGFDPVDVDLKLNMRLEEAVSAQTYSIKGNIYIPNLNQEIDSGFNKYQPIWIGDGSGDVVVYGGIHEFLIGGHVENMGDYQQKLPLGGFYVYLVGTNHATVSKQNDAGLPIDATFGTARNVYTITSYTDRNDVRNQIKGANVYSTFEISGVPPGKYVLRISPTEDRTKSVMTAGVCGYHMNECQLEVLSDGRIVVGGYIYPAGGALPNTYILDLTAGTSKNDATQSPFKARFMVLSGYIKDANDNGSIEFAHVQLYRDPGGSPNDNYEAMLALSDYLVNAWANPFIAERIDWIKQQICITDHNGYYACPTLVGAYHLSNYFPSNCLSCPQFEINDVQIGVTTIPHSAVGTGPDCWHGNEINATLSVTTNFKTELRGQVLLQGVPVAGVIAVNCHGDFSVTDANGLWRIVTYPQHAVMHREDVVLFYLDGSCIGFFEPGTNAVGYNIVFGATPLHNNGNFKYFDDVNILNILGTDPVNALKRGGVYDFGLIYYDHANRSGLTNINDGRYDEILANGRYGSKLFVPFYTEQKEIADPAVIEFRMAVSELVHSAINNGSDYTSPTVTFSGGGGSPQATATATMLVVSAPVTAQGSGYTSAPTVTFSSGTATAVAVLGTTVGVDDDKVVSIIITDPGGGYTSVPTLTFTGGGGTGAAADAVMGIDEVTILTAGAGYTSFPTLTINDPTGTGATCSFTMHVSQLILVSGGSGYTANPTIIFEGGDPTADALGTTTIYAGAVNTVDLDSGGAGYKSFPELKLLGGDLWLGSWPVVDWEVYNRPPKWATHWQWARIRNASIDRYIQFISSTVEYLDPSGTVVGYGGSPTQVRIKIINIIDAFRRIHPDSILVYDFVPGDHIRWIKSSSSGFFGDYYDKKITGWEAGAQALTFDIDNSMSEIGAGYLFEIYHPKLSLPIDNVITYEIGVCNEVGVDAEGRPYHKGETGDQVLWEFTDNAFTPNPEGDLGFLSTTPHGLSLGDKIKVAQDPGFAHPEYDGYYTVTSIVSTLHIGVNGTFLASTPPQGGLISKCATGNFYTGDTFYRFRQMPFNNTPATTRLFMVEDPNFSDFFASKAYDYGRPNRVDATYRQITRPSTIYWSEKFIPETSINGLSTVYDTSFQSYEAKFGSIQKLYSENLRLIMFQELKVCQIPVQQIIYNDLSLQNTVGASSVILSPQAIPYLGEYGIGLHPESFSVYGQAKYFIDVRRGAFLRLSMDGITPISINANMHNWFSDQCEKILRSNKKINIYGAFDIKFKEAVLAFDSYTYSIEDAGGRLDITVPAETIAFNEKENYFGTFYSYKPEFMCEAGVNLISFKSGALWKHNTNPLHANFYGVQHKAMVECVFNAFPSNQKILQAIALESDTPWNVVLTTPSGQTTPLFTGNFSKHENYQYAEFKRDATTPNVTNPINEGRVMRGQTALVRLEFQGTGYNKLYAANILYTGSNRSNK